MAQEVIKIRGGRTLNGEVNISGAKNSAVAIIPATLLAQGHVKLEGLPQISDVKTLVSLLEDLNIKASLNGRNLKLIQLKYKMLHYQIIKLNHYVLHTI